MKKVCIVTAARSEYGLLRWTIDAVHNDPDLELQLVVTGAHLLGEHGLTYKEIEADGYPISYKVDMQLKTEYKFEIAESMGNCSIAMAHAFAQLKPDLLVVLGDRYELLPICGAALVMNIPIAHIAGGDITEGAIDDKVRNAVSMMSTLHFPGTEASGNRLRSMLSSDANVFVVGETNLDNFVHFKKISREELAAQLSIDVSNKWILCTFHAETNLSLDENLKRVTNLIKFLKMDCSDYEVIVTRSNADFGGDIINEKFKVASSHNTHIHLFSSLGQLRYISMLYQVEFMIGNSSSGIFETPFVPTPTINIGNRQKGRIISNNIVSSDGSVESLRKAMCTFKSDRFKSMLKLIDNPYGDGHSSDRIVKQIKKFLYD